MRRKTYVPKSDRLNKAKKEALDVLRKTRENIGSSLIGQLEENIFQSIDTSSTTQRSYDDKGRVIVDRKKNLEIAMKFLEMQPHNDKLRHLLVQFAAEN